MPIISSIVFRAVHWAARRGLRQEKNNDEKERHVARRTGIRGETYGYWYLRKLGYVFVGKNYIPRGAKGEIDLIAYDGKTLAFVEVRTRTPVEGQVALPELSVTKEKQRVVIRSAQQFLLERRVNEDACRFDVLAIDNHPGRSPVVRLLKDAFSPKIR
jgi:putative endonuclease